MLDDACKIRQSWKPASISAPAAEKGFEILVLARVYHRDALLLPRAAAFSGSVFVLAALNARDSGSDSPLGSVQLERQVCFLVLWCWCFPLQPVAEKPPRGVNRLAQQLGVNKFAQHLHSQLQLHSLGACSLLASPAALLVPRQLPSLRHFAPSQGPTSPAHPLRLTSCPLSDEHSRSAKAAVLSDVRVTVTTRTRTTLPES